MLETLEEIKQHALSALEKAQDEAGLEDWRIMYLGRKSPLMGVFSQMGQLTPAERPVIGRAGNLVRTALEDALEQRLSSLREAALRDSLGKERIDVTLPGRPIPMGRLHPVTQTLRRIYRIFGEMGFQVYLARDVETDEYNFQLLNFPPHHPAREMQRLILYKKRTRPRRESDHPANPYLPGSDPRDARKDSSQS